MHIAGIELENVRSISTLSWKMAKRRARGWHVFIGDNGSGKSSLLRAVAIALVGPRQAEALRESWGEWLRLDNDDGRIHLELWTDAGWDPGSSAWSRRKGRAKIPLISCTLKKAGPTDVKLAATKDSTTRAWQPKSGWFSASYGPYRRFAGGDKALKSLFRTHPHLARHLSVFGENVALTESLEWLQHLNYKKLEGKDEGELLDPLIRFVNQPGFLPNDTRLELISSEGVRFRDGNGCVVGVNDMSDGYRSILSLTFELIRQLAMAYDGKQLFQGKRKLTIPLPGVVLIDEVDAHLHPTWQRTIGPWLCKHFPKMQFLVTTHSPLVCQGADSVFRLSNPGTDESPRMLAGADLNRLVNGDVLDAYGTGAFGSGVTRSDSSREHLGRSHGVPGAQPSRSRPVARAIRQEAGYR